MTAIATHVQHSPWSLVDGRWDSPMNEMAGSNYFETMDKLRLNSGLDDMKTTAIEHRIQPHLDELYQSSEESLSPSLGDEDEDVASIVEADDEDTELEDVEAFSASSLPFNLDMAVAINVVAMGKARVINVSPRWFTFPARNDRAPRSLSAAPSMPSRSTRRVTSRQNLNHSDPSITSTFASRDRNSSPDSMSSTTGRQGSPLPSQRPASRNGSVISIATERRGSATPSFLDSDPFEHTGNRKQGHSRLRSFSSRFKSTTAVDDETDSVQGSPSRAERRKSLIRPIIIPQSSSSMVFDTRTSSSEEETDVRPAEPSRKTFISPLRNVPREHRVQSVPTKGMMARGANERAPMLELPPCPKDYAPAPGPSYTYSMPSPKKTSGLGSLGLKRRKSLLSSRA